MPSNRHDADLLLLTCTLFGCSKGHHLSFSRINRVHRSVASTWGRCLSSFVDGTTKLYHPGSIDPELRGGDHSQSSCSDQLDMLAGELVEPFHVLT